MSGLEVIETAAAMQAFSEAERKAGKTIGCVPTMGYLHKGHLSLIRECARRADTVVMTLFVNPTQFGPGEDLEKYPRDLKGDCEKAAQAGARVVFHPSGDEMYPQGYQTYVEVEKITRDLEGEFRPVHFRGVTTVVTKLLCAVQPHLAAFGEKDFQQLRVIERMVKDLNMGVEIMGCPTVREPDGLAMSSRNVYLSKEERQRARAISRALFTAREAVAAGEEDASRLAEQAVRMLSDAGLDLDYVAIRDDRSLAPLERIDRPARMLIAARAGKTRLIDNMYLNP